MDRQAFLDHGAHQLESGIGHQGRAGIAHQRDALSPMQPLQQTRPLAPGVVIVIGGEGFGDAMDGQKLAGDTRILGGNDIAPPQHIQRPQGDVTRIADRRGRDIKARRERISFL